MTLADLLDRPDLSWFDRMMIVASHSDKGTLSLHLPDESCMMGSRHNGHCWFGEIRSDRHVTCAPLT